MQNIVDISSLISKGKIVKTVDIDPDNDYAIVQKWRAGNRKRGADLDAYESFAIPLSELLGGGTTYTGSNGIVIIANDIQLASNNISQFTNDSGYLTVSGIPTIAWAPDGNSFGTLRGLGTNDTFDLPIVTDGNEVARFDVNGHFVINQTIDPSSQFAITAAASINGITSNVAAGYGFLGIASTGVGVRGVNGSGYGIGVDGFSTNNVGVRGQSTNGVGGQFIAPVSLLAKGIDATASNWAIQAKDSADNPILYARNDGKILMGTGGLIYKLNVYGSTLTQGWWSRGINRITYGNNEIQLGDARPNIEWDNSVDGQVFITGIKNDDTWGIFCKGASDYGFEINRTTRNIGISISPASDIKLKVRGASATSADYAGVFETSTGVTLFSVRNDGRMSAPLLQTGNAGLASGDLYVDTAANILANGDRVVGRKV